MGAAGDAAAFLQTYGWLGITILLVVGGVFRFYVFRWQYDALEKSWQARYDEATKDRDWWRTQALTKDERLDTALVTLEKAVDIANATPRGPTRQR